MQLSEEMLLRTSIWLWSYWYGLRLLSYIMFHESSKAKTEDIFTSFFDVCKIFKFPIGPVLHDKVLCNISKLTCKWDLIGSLALIAEKNLVFIKSFLYLDKNPEFSLLIEKRYLNRKLYIGGWGDKCGRLTIRGSEDYWLYLTEYVMPSLCVSQFFLISPPFLWFSVFVCYFLIIWYLQWGRGDLNLGYLHWKH